MYFDSRKSVTIPARIITHRTGCNSSDEKFACKSVSIRDSYKYLGITIRRNLKCDTHIKNVCAKLRSAIAIRAKLKNIANFKTKKAVYFALIDSTIQYMLPTYGGTYDTTIEPIQRLEKKAVRMVHSASYRANSTPLIKAMGTHRLREVYEIAVTANR